MWMMRCVTVLSVFGVSGAAVAEVSAELVWRHIPQSPALTQPPLFVDLDGDGLNEVVYLAETPFGQDGSPDVFVTVLAEVDGDLSQVDVFPVKNGGGKLFAVPSAEGAGRDLLLTSGHWATSLLRLGGRPLTVRGQWPLADATTLLAVDDIDADGGVDLLIGRYHHSNDLMLVDLQSWTTRWQRGSLFHGEVVVAQLDSDPQLEIVVGGGELKVLDGIVGAGEWTLQAPAFGPVVAGRFDSQASIRTFAHVGSTTTILRSEPWGVLRSFGGLPGSNAYSVAFDVDDDGIDELALPPGLYAGFDVQDALTGVRKAVIDTGFANARPPAFGRLEPGGPTLLAYGSTSGTTTNGRNGMRVRELAGGAPIYSADLEFGPFSMATFADVDGDGVHEIVRLSASRVPHPLAAIPFNVVVTSLDGAEIARLQDVGLRWQHNSSSSPPLPMLHAVDLDGEPGDEIIIAGYSEHGTAMVRALRGHDLSTVWTEYLIMNFESVSVRGLAVADFDADGRPDPVVFAEKGLESRLIALSGLTGAPLWQSVNFGATLQGPVGLDALQLDGDIAAEIVVSLGGAVFVFDAASKLLEWSLSDGSMSAISATAWGEGEGCRVGIVDAVGSLRVHDCAGAQRLYDIVLPEGARIVVPEVEDGWSFLAAAKGKLFRAAPFREPAALTDYLGAELDGNRANGWRRLSQDPPQMELLLGSVAQLARIRVSFPDALMRSDFEKVSEPSQ